MSKISAEVGRHLFIGIAGTELTTENRRLLNFIQPGGVTLFTRNAASAEQLRSLVHKLRWESRRAPMIAIDQEGGRVNRLRNIVGEIPNIAALKTRGNVRDAENLGWNIGRSLVEHGIYFDFAPVLDLELFDETTDNALRDRCWGRTADEVTAWAGAFVHGLEIQGVAACPKHFPGLGGARQDSHETLPTIRRSREELMREDLFPFAHILPQVPAVMVGHGHYPALVGERPLPATLSRAIMTDLLRGQLGFNGLVLTDDMEMGAIAKFGSFELAVVEAFNAGADLILVCHSPAKIFDAHEALVKAVEQGTISRDRWGEAQQQLKKFRNLGMPA